MPRSRCPGSGHSAAKRLPVAAMSDIRTETVEYSEGGDIFEGFVAWDAARPGRRPAVLIAHDWAGLLDASRERAKKLAELGYVGFALDAYGKGSRGTPGADNSALLNPMLADRALLRRRLLAAVEASKSQGATDPDRIGAIGYCFGGLCVLDLARANAPGLRGVVCFHGIYAPPGLGEQSPIRSKVLVCHGWDDPFTPPAATVGLAKELTDAKADWQIHAYGHTVHAFTSEGANNPAIGAKYDATADRRSFASMTAFLEEAFAS
jgi:dienelactone hydrolase